MKIKVLIFLFLCVLISGQEYQEVSVSEKRFENMNHLETLLQKEYHTENPLSPKKTNPNFQQKYKDADFDYTTVKPKQSLWERMMNRISKFLQSIFGEFDSQKASSFIQILIRVVAVVIIALVLYFLIKFLLGKDGSFLFGKKNRKVVLSEADLHENIHEIRFEEIISSYERNSDFRAATRYRFLQTLKKLSDRNIIRWEPEKTNKDYLKDIQSAEVKSDFRELAFIYENVWYGEFDINEESYRKFKLQFSKFLS